MNIKVKFMNNLFKSNEVLEFSSGIMSAWNRSVEGILEACHLLIKAKALLKNDEFQSLNIPFSKRTVNRLLSIGNYPFFATHVSHLPQSWGTLYVLSRLDVNEFQAAIKKGSIYPGMTRNEANYLLLEKAVSRQRKETQNMIKVVSIYVKNDDDAELVLKKLKSIPKSDNFYIDNNSYANRVDRLNSKRIKSASKKGRKKAIDAIYHFRFEKLKDLRANQNLTVKSANRKFNETWGEVADFIEAGKRSMIDFPFSENAENMIDTTLSCIGSDKTEFDFIRECFECM